MNIHKTAIMAAQIIGETLPISSSTHVWLVDTIFKRSVPWTDQLGTESFMDLLFIPTLFVIGFFFKNRLINSFNFFLSTWRTKGTLSHRKKWILLHLRIISYVITAITAFTLTFFSIKYFLPTPSQYPLILPTIGLCITALSQLSTALINREKKDSYVTFFNAILIGFCQGFAAIPGISRLSITLISARWLGIASHRAFEFSTALQLITFLGNPVRNLLSHKTKYATLYFDHLKHISLLEIGIIAACGILSYYGLLLTWRLNQERSLWKITPYFAIPLALIYLIKIHTFSYFA
jgi:undecaprenyl-diphosphatase